MGVKPPAAAQGLDERLRIFETREGKRHAGELFRECFGAPFPVPRDGIGLPIPTPAPNWHQFVAVYTWPDGREETVGFCNWIRHGEVYLQGGMCVRASFYRRMPREHFAECQARGGLAQMMMANAAGKLNDCKAWFGYCGDRKALAADLRAGYETTDHRFVIVKWFASLPEVERRALIESVSAIGAF